jgi:ribose 5-phosphate isomerase B
VKIAIGSDHGGYPLNERIIEDLEKAGHTILDFGTHDGTKPDDYPTTPARSATPSSRAR